MAQLKQLLHLATPPGDMQKPGSEQLHLALQLLLLAEVPQSLPLLLHLLQQLHPVLLLLLLRQHFCQNS
jgi:hypothetical protein